MPKPSDAQVEVANHFVKWSADAPEEHHAQVIFGMEDDGFMCVTTIEDEMRMSAFFDRSGAMQGDWIV